LACRVGSGPLEAPLRRTRTGRAGGQPARRGPGASAGAGAGPGDCADAHDAAGRHRAFALDRTQPVLPVAFAASEKRTHDYVRHGTTNLLAALNVAIDEVLDECEPNRDAMDFLAFMKKAVKPHAGKEIHVVLDNLSTRITPEVKAWPAKHPQVHFHFTPVGSSWLNQIGIRFGILTRQSIRRGTFSGVHVLIKQIHDYIDSWNQQVRPFTWTATADQALLKVRLVQSSAKKLANNNSN
jgi:transposase